MIKYFDIHGHLNFSDYDIDREEVISRSKSVSVGVITVGTDLESSRQAVQLAKAYENTWAIVGQHPTDVSQAVFDSVRFKELAQHPKVVAIGECGLDYFHTKPEDLENQRKIFIEQIKLANEVNKPLMLHVRNGKTNQNAYQETVKILKEHARVKFNFHFFAGTKSEAKEIVDLGGLMSFTGVLTFTHDYDELVEDIPLDRIMSETDCPYVAPVPYRGQRNEPSYVIEVVKAIARIKSSDQKQVATQLLANTKGFFNI